MSAQLIWEILFWIVLLLLVQNYIGVYLTLLVLTGLKRKASDISDTETLPSMSVFIPAFNEEEVIADRLENVLAQNYPADLIQILVSSDNSVDNTEQIVSSFELRGVQLRVFKERQGKLGMIDQVIPDLTGDIIVVTDANVVFEPEALLNVGRRFSDPKVGGLCCPVELRQPGSGVNVEREISYRHYEIALKRLMGRMGAVIGVFGGFYAFRRRLFRPIGPKPCHDDIVIPMEILSQGFRVDFARDAIAHEETMPSISGEFRRRIRMVAFNLNTFPRFLSLAFRSGIVITLMALFYKAIRWLSPYLLVLLFILSVFLGVSNSVYALPALGLVLICLFALIGWILDRFGVRAGFMSTAYQFAMMNLAAYIGILTWLKGIKSFWNPRAE